MKNTMIVNVDFGGQFVDWSLWSGPAGIQREIKDGQYHGGNFERFAARIRKFAERRGWVVEGLVLDGMRHTALGWERED